MLGDVATALKSFEVFIVSSFVITNKSAALDRHRSRYVWFGAVFYTNLARSPEVLRQRDHAANDW